MSARLLPSFIPERFLVDDETIRVHRKKNRRTPQVFIATPKRHGRTVWVEWDGFVLPYRVDMRSSPPQFVINKNAITGEMLALPEVGGWAV